jgi:hypothetical protein
MSSESHASGPPGLLQRLAPIALLVGLVASENFMFRMGARNPSLVLILLFAGWVLTPFAALAFALLKARAWPARPRVILHGLTLLLAVVSPVIYANPPAKQPASVFLLTPLVSLVLIGILLLVAAKRR